MNIFFVIIVVIFMGGIIFLTNPFGENKETREQFLEKLTKYLDGKKENIKEKEDAHRICFKYYDREFVYEDVMEVGFSKTVNEGYLKVKTNKILNLAFSSLQKGGIVYSETLIVSNLKSAAYNAKIEIKVPDELKVFKLNTTDVIQAKALIENPKVASVLSYYKDADVKGQHRMSLKIQNGVIVLTFHPSIMQHPSLISLHTNLSMINDNLEKLSVLCEAVDDVQT